MTPELISRVINLVKAKGDRIVLADSATGKAVAILDLEDYERLVLSATATQEEPASVSEQPNAQQTDTSSTHEIEERPALTYRPAVAVESTPVAPPPKPAEPATRPTPIEPRVEAPSRAPEIASKPTPTAAQKNASISENPFQKRAVQLGVKPEQGNGVTRDLTQAELLDKINRDIGDWKTAQERKRAQELTSVAQPALKPQPESLVEEEERFYLEPIE